MNMTRRSVLDLIARGGVAFGGGCALSRLALLEALAADAATADPFQVATVDYAIRHGVNYFEHLLSEIHEIRMSERRFYQKITGIYSTAMDCDKDAETTRVFFGNTADGKVHEVVAKPCA